MTANYSAHVHRLLIGNDWQDWSPQFALLDVGFEKRARDGKFPLTGTLSLKRLGNAPESMNPRVNRARWARSQPVFFYITDSAGTMHPHPAGRLFILKEPPPAAAGSPTFNIPVGCRLALRDFAEPDGADQSGIELGFTTSLTSAIGSLLAYADVPNWIGEVPDNPIPYPLPKQGGSYVGQACALAYAGYKGLYQDEQGRIQVKDLRLNPTATPLVSVMIGRDEVGYTPSEGSETPVEELLAVSTTYDILDTWQTVGGCNEDFGPPSDDHPVGTATILRRTCTYDKQDATSKIHEVKTDEAKGLLLPDQFPGDESLTFSSNSIEAFYFELRYVYVEGAIQERREGRLLQKEKTLIRPFAVALRDFWGQLSNAERLSYSAFSPTQAEKDLTYLRYSDKDQVAAVQTVSYAPVAAIDPSLNPAVTPPSGITKSARNSESWTQRLPGEWEHLTIQEEPLIKAFPDAVPTNATLSKRIGLVTSNYEPTLSGSQNQPPAAERKGDRYLRQDRIIRGLAKFGAYVGSDSQPRRRTIEVPYCTNEGQLETIAKFEGELLPGRRLGQMVKLPCLDVFILNPGPLPTVACLEPREILVEDTWVKVHDIVIYQADALHYLHNPTEGLIVFDGIWLATIPADTGHLLLPYLPITVLGVGLGLACELELIPYNLSPAALTLDVGLGLGFELTMTLVTDHVITSEGDTVVDNEGNPLTPN